ncbi:hypothetical protein X474_26035 [Dethiosulfatarculus sandiegensis]|uniref:Uncharacterized protein n=1 Tax=Dethiosulfatarculus sandiegensis TaxID=1429043 RepID=A0A0D2JP37_9BACT|nr:hypothetical protein X474_26035 [Dethiosulfatarculus sandiegensis]
MGKRPEPKANAIIVRVGNEAKGAGQPAFKSLCPAIGN